ncbi:MAG: glycine zipper domain-containing protein [Caulobacter sp.]|nr:glycine zipper domain-containing protein [Caulobacter sp.]
MKTHLIAVATASIVALTAGAASAQSYPQSWEQYEAQQRQYQRQQSDYQDRRADYADQRRAYEAKRQQYLRDQAAYDRRYGRGAYVRRYGEWRYDPPYAGAYGRDVAYNDAYAPYRDSPCERRRDGNTTAGAIIGALAGAAIGSNVAASGVRTEGAVLGALVGGGVGGAIGRSSAKCDNDGYWYSRDQTISYREAGYRRGQRSGRYAYNDYSRRGCRLAAAPTEWGGRTEYRYVRVCPDNRGRYRITN